MPSVLFITENASSPSTRYRATLYFPYLREAGWSVEHTALADGKTGRLRMLRQAARADVVVVVRKTFNLLNRWPLRAVARRLVYDFDDALFVRDNGEASSRKMASFEAIVRAANVIWAGNAYLADQARIFNPSTITLPTAVEPQAYPSPPPQRPTDSVDLVWIGHNGTRVYLESLVPLLVDLALRYPRMRLKIVANFDLPPTHLRTLAVPWSSTTESTDLASAHIGLAPLPGDAWAQGKCGLRTLQYMASSLPVIASDLRAHRDIIIPDQTGIIADTPEQWRNAIVRLLEDAELRDRMGILGRARVEKDYAFSVTSRTMLKSLDSLLTKG